MDETTPVGNAGKQTHAAKFTPTDVSNYNVLEDIEVEVAVAQAAGLPFVAHVALNVTYTPTLTLGDLISSLSPGYAFVAAANTALSAGNHSFEATYTDPSGNYTAVSGSIAVNVAKANPAYTAPTGLTATYGETLEDVALTGGWSWMDDATPVGNAGTQTHKAKFTPEDDANYNIVEIDVDVEVAKADPPHVTPEGLTATVGQTLEDVTLPDGGWSWMDKTASVGAVGERRHMAKYTPTDVNNYNVLTNIEVKVTVSKNSAPTAPDAPTLASKTWNSITLTAVAGCEYSKDGATTWQESNVFNDLLPETPYAFYQRIAETDDAEA
jgi:hypothetical protein